MRDQDLPYFDVDELAHIFGYTNKQSVYQAIRANRFPVPTYRLGKGSAGRIVADVEIVRVFFVTARKEGMKELKEVFSAKTEAVKVRALIAEERALHSRRDWAAKIRKKYNRAGADEQPGVRRCHVCGAAQENAKRTVRVDDGGLGA